MTAITATQYIHIERTVRIVSDAVRLTATKEVGENMRTAEYVMSVVRNHAEILKRGFENDEEREDFHKSLYTALYR